MKNIILAMILVYKLKITARCLHLNENLCESQWGHIQWQGLYRYGLLMLLAVLGPTWNKIMKEYSRIKMS